MKYEAYVCNCMVHTKNLHTTCKLLVSLWTLSIPVLNTGPVKLYLATSYVRMYINHIYVEKLYLQTNCINVITSLLHYNVS